MKPSRQAAVRQAKYAERNTQTVWMDLSSLDDVVDELGEDIESAVRPAAQAGAQVLYDRVRLNVSGMGRKTGNLFNSIYQVYSEKDSVNGSAVYHVSWNAKKAPHGHLMEHGFLQRYRYYQGADGKIRPMVRPGMDGRPRPRKRASQAEKDAYYVTLPAPIQVPARAFVRRAIDQFPAATAAVEAELRRRLNERNAA